MGRPSVGINHLRCKRLKTIIKEQGMTQSALAKKINLSQQSITKIIHEDANLTDDRARDIINLFPQYNLLWLLGQSDNKMLEEEQHNRAIDSGIRLEAPITVLDTAYMNVCLRDGIDVQTIDNIPELCLLKSQLEDFAEMLMRNYLHRKTSHFWNTLDSFNDSADRKNDEGH